MSTSHDTIERNDPIITPVILTPPQYTISQEGVALYEDRVHFILDIPLWCSSKDDITATFEWVTPQGQHHKSILLLDTLMDQRETGKWLLRRGVVGFVPTRKGLEDVTRFMLACIQMFDKGFVADKAGIAKAAPHALSTIAAGFINRHSAHITEVLIAEQYWTIPYANYLRVYGRAQREGASDFSFAPHWSLAVRPSEFIDYAQTLSFDRRELKRLLRLGKVKNRQVALTRDDERTYVWIIPLLDSDYVQRGSSVRCLHRSKDKV